MGLGLLRGETSQLLSRGGLENHLVVLCVISPLPRRDKCPQELTVLQCRGERDILLLGSLQPWY